MPPITPQSAEELAEALKAATSRSDAIAVFGNNSKRLMAGPVLPAGTLISTTALRRVLHYERNDLTVSVECGMQFSDLQSLLASNGQMIALDPPLFPQATVGGVISSNASGPMRYRFGTARDLVIGMTFVTLDGKLVKTGGMVVKNVAGLDMGKLMIGSFGTLAVISSVNFRVHSLPAETATFLFASADLKSAIERRDAITRSILQPIAIDLLSPVAAGCFDMPGSQPGAYVLAVRAGGSRAVLDRYARDLQGGEQLSGAPEHSFWKQIGEFTPAFLHREPAGIVVRISTTLSDIAPLLHLVPDAYISRAGSGVTYAYLTDPRGLSVLRTAAAERHWSAVVEFAPDDFRLHNELWLERSSPRAADSFAMMSKVKQMFDPLTLLNRSRLYGRL